MKSRQTDPFVTILMPVLNASPYLSIAINSIVCQTFEDWELLVLDDDSTDGSMKIVHSFADSRIRIVLREGEAGLVARLNHGIALAKGKYIARMDADDIAFPERLARQVDYLEMHPDVDLVGAHVIVFRDNAQVVGLPYVAVSQTHMCSRPWNGIPLAHPTWMGKTDWFRRFRYAVPEYRRAEDQELLLSAYPTSTFACLPEILLGYRQGAFRLNNLLMGRSSLLRAQLRHFAMRRKYWNICFSVAVFFIKIMLDLITCFPKADLLYSLRVSKKPKNTDVENFKNLYFNLNK